MIIESSKYPAKIKKVKNGYDVKTHKHTLKFFRHLLHAQKFAGSYNKKFGWKYSVKHEKYIK